MKSSANFRVGLFLLLSLVMIAGFIAFILVKKNVFTNHLYFTLSSSTGEGITEGMPLLFSGFEIGKVEKFELDNKGTVLVLVKVPEEHAHRINKSSVFTLERPLIGSSRFIVTTPNLTETFADSNYIFETQMVDDINEVIKKLQPMVEKIDDIANNLKTLTDEKSHLNKTLVHVEKIAGDLAQKRGIIEMMAGDKAAAAQFREGVAHLNNSLGEIETLVSNANKTLVKADDQILGDEGTLAKVNAIVEDVNKKMADLDILIASLIKSGENLQEGTKDMDVLRKDLDSIINSVNSMVKDVRSVLPTTQNKDLELP
ncbi:MCE family protein [bacterium]|nr:MCE family protein [bacterium]